MARRGKKRFCRRPLEGGAIDIGERGSISAKKIGNPSADEGRSTAVLETGDEGKS